MVADSLRVLSGESGCAGYTPFADYAEENIADAARPYNREIPRTAS
jgi:hypothetical protein